MNKLLAFEATPPQHVKVLSIPPINPDWKTIPGMNLVVQFAGSVQALAILGVIVTIIAAGAMIAVYSVRGSNRVTEAKSALLAGALGAVAIGAAVSVVTKLIAIGATAQ